jgi:hypothetical protein
MKGQYLILAEILLFAFGLAMANYAISTFQGAQGRTSEIAAKDNFRLIANSVSTAVVKASENGNSSIRLFLPEEIAGREYAIALKEDSVIVFDLNDPAINVTQKLFNITQQNCNSDNAFCARGAVSGSFVASSAKAIEIFSNGKDIVIRRLRLT